MVNTSIALNMIRGTYFVGEDATEGTADDTTVETELLDFDIPAGTVTNGIIIFAQVSATPGANLSDYTFRVKVGDNSSEVTRNIMIYRVGDGSESLQPTTMITVVDDEDWAAAQTVSITGQMSDSTAGGDSVFGHNLTIIGY